MEKATSARTDLEKLLVDETAEPKALPFSLLEEITGYFSDDQEIGRGGFAVVYKGILGDRVVAVKRLVNAFQDEMEFHREVECLMGLKHKNIVRILGYCDDRQGSMERHNGRLVMADVHKRLLCFEYIPNGSLDKYIADAYREWGTCYTIIKGICEGLHHLHENRIIHLDLKPSNILLDDNTTPKITDFGVSRYLREDQSRHITKNILGTIGYLAPEFWNGGEITRSADLYSLGVIIIEILTGQKECQATEDVLASWSDRLESSQRDTLCQQIRLCYETALQCIELSPKNRPSSAGNIIDRLHEMESREIEWRTKGRSESFKKKGRSDFSAHSAPKRLTHGSNPPGVQMVEAASSISVVASTESKGNSKTDDLAEGLSAYDLVEMKHPLCASPSEADSRDGLNEYHSPELMYVRVCVIAAHGLLAKEKLAPTIAKIQMGNQIHRTQPRQTHGLAKTVWNEEFMLVASEPFEDPLVVTVEERVAAGRDEAIGCVTIPVAPPYVSVSDLAKSVPSKWFSLSCGMKVEEEAAADVTTSIKDRESSETFASKIHLKMSLETAYHVLDESALFMSDLQPAAKELRKSAIGILEVGTISACGLDGNKNPYAVAKYGAKWVRTRTLLPKAELLWDEQYTWEVFDLSTVITIGVFESANLEDGPPGGDGGNKDQKIGKVRIRLTTLESNRVYTDYYPLMALSPSGLKNTGELHFAVRFTCTAWANMLAQYGRPLLPRMHYTSPISLQQQDSLRLNAVQIVATRLARADPPLQRQVVEYMLDVEEDSYRYSIRRSRANFYRIASLFSPAFALQKWFHRICNWKNAPATMLVHVVFLHFVCYPERILPMVFLVMTMIGARNYGRRPQQPPQIDRMLSCLDPALPDELEEDFDTFPTSSSDDNVRKRYDRMRNIARRLQMDVGDLAIQAERVKSLLSWRDPWVTPIFITLSLVVAVALYLTPFRVVATVTGLFFLRHPSLRSTNNLLCNFYRRLPSKEDSMLEI